MRHWAAALPLRSVLVLSVSALPVLAQPVIRAENPRGYGWWLGDELEQHIRIDLPEGVTLERASLPRPRAVDYWLDLREVAIHESAGVIELTLRWQNFYSALEPKPREVPPSPIRFSDSTESALPGFGFVTSPIRPLTATSSPGQMMPDPAFHLIDPLPNRIGLAVALAVFTGVLATITWHQAWWPFRARPLRPFTQAARALARLDDGAARHRRLHRAFDAAYGRVLIAADLPQFLTERPEFRPLSRRLAEFFRRSNAVFFGAGAADGDDVVALARDLSRIERGRR